MERNRLPRRGGKHAFASGNANLVVMVAAAIAAALMLWFWLGGRSTNATRTSSGPAKAEYAYSASPDGQLFRSTPGRGVGFAPTPTTDAPPDPIQISRDAARQAVSSGVMHVTLPNRTSYPVRFERQETSANGDWTFVGRVNTRIGKLAAVLTFGRAGVFGVLPAPDGRMLHIVTNHGQAFIQPAGGLVPVGMPSGSQVRDIAIRKAGAARQVRNAAAPNAVQAPRVASTGKLRAAATVAAGPEVRIDVLGIYTTNLVALRGSVAAAESEFTNLTAIANQAHIDSGTVARMHLVGMRQVDYTPGLFNQEALYALQENRLPGVDVYALRDLLAADLVAMLRPYAEGDDSCGIAYVSGAFLSPEGASPDDGFSVTATEACGPLVLAHELGHNMGSAHDIDNSDFQGAYPFSHGYRQWGPPGFATVMAYASSGESWIGYFSNPNIASCLGVRCGNAIEADNARSINLMAERISRFRDPSKTVSVLDAPPVFEQGHYSVSLNFEVRLNAPAPVGGVRFDIATSGGTATAGVDYVATRLTGQVIPQGQTSYWLNVEVLEDALIESDETVGVQLSNVSGMTPFDVSATGSILNDDPRAIVTGRITAPAGMVLPTSNFAIGACSEQQSPAIGVDCTGTAVAADYSYLVSVLTGSKVRLHLNPGDPYAEQFVELGVVNGNVVRNIELVPAAYIRGKVRWPAGQPAPTGSLRVSMQRPYPNGNLVTEYQVATAPDYGFRFKVEPGLPIVLGVENPPAPYVTQLIDLGPVRSNVVRDIQLQRVPSIVISHARIGEIDGVVEPPVIRVRLSAPAPPGGARFRLTTFDGSAMSDNDYNAFAMDVRIPEGAAFFQAQPIQLQDDVWKEPEESFGVTARHIIGAWLPANGFIRVVDDDSTDEPTWIHGDFMASGRSDVVWRNSITGANSHWSSPEFLWNRELATVSDMSWKIVGIGDFDNDHQADLLWRNTTTGRNTIWLIGHWQDQRAVAAMADTQWQVVGVGDFNGDRRSDILWRHARNGSNVIWRSANALTPQAVAGVTNIDWKVAGIGDFNLDGRDDIFWRNDRTGSNAIWHSADAKTQSKVTSVTNVEWVVAAVSDFNGDRLADVFWRNRRTGKNVIWRTGNSASQQAVAAVPSLDWEVADTGDYDRDGRFDVLWRNRRSGSNAIWLAANSASPLPIPAVPVAWRIAQ